MKHVSDAQILHRIEEGDEKQFAVFMRRHASSLEQRLSHRALPRGVEIEDILQETWIILLRHLRGETNAVDLDQNVAGYVLGIAEKARLQFLQVQHAKKREGSHVHFSLDFEPPEHLYHDENLLRMESEEEESSLYSAIDTLPEESKTAILLSLQGMKREEIAQRVHSTTEAVTKRIQRATQLLHERFKVA